METPFETGPARYQPPANYPYARDPKLRFDQRRLARVVGFIAFAMPVVLGFGGYALGRFRVALSEYYYEVILLGDFFVGCLVAIGALLMAYRGWTPKVAQLATLAGIAALLVAFVPMNGWIMGCEELADDGTCAVQAVRYPVIGYWVHAGAAGLLFAILSFFCLFVFTKIPVDDASGQKIMSPAKMRRNAIYVTSGILIALGAISIAVAGLLGVPWWFDNNMTFWAEAMILGAFGASWLVQGRALAPFNDPRDREDAKLAKQVNGQQLSLFGFGLSDK
ncbi:hypothetical protein NAP1_04505 [Erythrobacter sp. NAP1]|uniref:hypothetical protein n=1 Tax=Erythrobacter sp. NAP1 TaxID=237727 RepID=UPI0000686D49|nr:hypothetical protein [Erythrobacter sp. NAP1]EAQ30007.1 hypothetical protein NAP1_04505 [Erythrobacter sp. NAP1]